MATSINRDSLDREKRGRLIKDHQHEAAARARVSVLLASGGPLGRARPAPGSTPGGKLAKAPSRESVLKVIGWTKAARSAVHQARYIGRARDADRGAGAEPLVMENERGETVSGQAAIDAEIASWRLVPDRHNLSAAARKATAEERRAMNVSDRLNRRQSVHMIFSVPARSTTDPEKLRAAVRAGLAETFADAGHRYVFTVHTEHSARPHAHIIVKATAEQDSIDGGRARALRMGLSELQALRHVLTRYAQAHGIDVIATRREDRDELRQQILSGQEPLRTDRSWHQRNGTKQGRTFEKAAPNWYQQHGADYERRRAEAAAGQVPQVPAAEAPTGAAEPPRPSLFKRLFGKSRQAPAAAQDAPNAPARGQGYVDNFANVRAGRAAKEAAITGEHPAVAQLAGNFARSHYDPRAARDSFLAMYREAPRVAVWAAHNHPEAFGATTGTKPDRISTKLLKELPAESRPTAEAWSKQHERAQRDEIAGLKRATDQARAARSAERSVERIRRSMERAAIDAERAIRHDTTEAKETAQRIRDMARKVEVAKPTPAGDKAARYVELERRLREQDRSANRPMRDQRPGPHR